MLYNNDCCSVGFYNIIKGIPLSHRASSVAASLMLRPRRFLAETVAIPLLLASPALAQLERLAIAVPG